MQSHSDAFSYGIFTGGVIYSVTVCGNENKFEKKETTLFV
uniref:Bm229 n=1 Tax=Brugia malayi TaxID=6279 RepID=A0A1I9G080_BRUMA|nr:Bm229 [Brugia malayi]